MDDKKPPISAVDYEVPMRFWVSELWEMFIALSERVLRLDVLIERDPRDETFRGMRASATRARDKVQAELSTGRTERFWRCDGCGHEKPATASHFLHEGKRYCVFCIMHHKMPIVVRLAGMQQVQPCSETCTKCREAQT